MEIFLPGQLELRDGTIVILNNIKYIIHYGYFVWMDIVEHDWYGVSIPDQTIIPITQDALIGCTVFYYPLVGCYKDDDNKSAGYVYSDKYQVQRSFITVETMIDRDELAPNMSIDDLPNGKLVRVLRPDNLHYDPKTYQYTYDSVLSSATWELYNIYVMPDGGIPKSDLSEEVQEALDSTSLAIKSINTTIVPDSNGNVTLSYRDVDADQAGTAAAEAAIVQGNVDIVSQTVSGIQAVIPNAATAQNQLADKNFVNSSVATNTANFIGTFSSVAALEAYSGPVTNNDYAFVTETTGGQVTAYERWKYNAAQQAWLYEYTLNNSSFTSDQWAAINSNITANLVTAYSEHIADSAIHVSAADRTAWDNKVTSVNNKTGVVTLSYSDVGADPDGAALAVSQQLNSHADNTHIHTDDNEKSAWYARAILTVSGEDLIISYIESPTISLSESVVSWNPVYNATSYKVYADNGNTSELVATIATTSIDLADYISTDGTYTVTVIAHSDTYGDSANSNSVEWVLQTIFTVLNDNTWDTISRVSSDGLGADYWAVGDMKQIHLEGTVGTLELNTDLNVYIMGFDHNSTLEGTGITFGSFKTTDSSHKDVCLVDSHYGANSTDGSKWFNMSHWSNINYGGWAGCDMRYDILGSTDVAPSGYGSAPTTSRVGYDATSTCATNPVANTLMSCLPSELRAVMKPMTKYTDNASGGSHNAEANVTASVDYLPLLAEYEIFGARSYANEHEYKKQAQYAYYVAGNSKVKYQHSSTGSTAIWWERSPIYNNAYRFCLVDSGGFAGRGYAQYAYGVAPVFLI